MSSFDSTPLHVYLIIVFSLALIAGVLATGVAGYELVRHRRSVSAARERSGANCPTPQPVVDLIAHAGRRTRV